MKWNQKLVCTPVNKKGINNFFMATPDTQLFAISTSKNTLKTLKNFKNKTFSRWRTLSVTEHILLERLYQFVGTVNVYLDTIIKVDLFALSCIPIIHGFKVL